ncbi:MAG: phage holin family protein [candidate division Zixibacteria bacterium]|nr:phage holin family protein [candidate division Zixibacteria bacterium]
MNMLIRWFTTALAIFLLTYLWDGIKVDSFTTALIAALVLGLMNAIVRPVLVLLTLPLTVLSIGLFLLVINGTLLYLVAYLIHGFDIDGFVNAVIASIAIWAVGLLLNVFFKRD